jgi:hypothetical protein
MTERAASISPPRQELLSLLLLTTMPLATRGRPEFKPLWAEEATHRADYIVRLIARLERAAPLSASDFVAARLERGIALELAALFQALEIVDDGKVLPCSDLVRTLVRDLVELFGPVAGEISGEVSVQTCLEPIHLPQYKRRALVLIVSSLVCNVLGRRPIGGSGASITAMLLRVNAAQGLFRIDLEGWPGPRTGRRKPFELIADLASPLKGEVTYRSRAFSGSRVEITFPLQKRPQRYGRIQINDDNRIHA